MAGPTSPAVVSMEVLTELDGVAPMRVSGHGKYRSGCSLRAPCPAGVPAGRVPIASSSSHDDYPRPGELTLGEAVFRLFLVPRRESAPIHDRRFPISARWLGRYRGGFSSDQAGGSHFQSSDFGQASQMTLRLTELGSQEGLNKVPSQHRAGDSTAQTDDVHVIILHPLPGREVVRDQARADSRNLVGAHCRANAAAANRHSAFYLTRRNSPGQRENEVRIVVTRVQLEGSEFDNFMTCCSESSAQVLL